MTGQRLVDQTLQVIQVSYFKLSRHWTKPSAFSVEKEIVFYTRDLALLRSSAQLFYGLCVLQRSSSMGFARPRSLLLCSCEMVLTGSTRNSRCFGSKLAMAFSYSLNHTFFFVRSREFKVF